LKIVEAMAAGLPVVSTTVGAQGLEKADADALAIADTPAAFVQTTLRLLNNATERERRSQCGRVVIEKFYGWQALGQQFANFCRRIAQRTAPTQ
jgi:glycosyltransferase involved in cell wall biosynthesis